MEAVLHYSTTNHRCRSQLLLEYFGEKDSHRCGICDVCRRQKSQLNKPNAEAIIRKALETGPKSYTELEKLFEDPNQVPRHCVTMGVGTIMDSASLMLYAFGEGKAEIISKAVEGPVSAMVPASILQMHPSVKVIVDEAAASQLANIEYYKEVYENKPDWQK